MTVHVAIFHPTIEGRVEGVRVFEDDDELPDGSIVISNWLTIGQPPFEEAELRQTDGVLYWHDPRTVDQLAAEARSKRDGLLLDADKLVMPYIERGRAVPESLLDYKQSLRDLTLQPGFPNSITWPALPDL